LRRPKPDLCERAFIAAGQFAKHPAMTLGMDGTSKNLHSGDPGVAASLPGSRGFPAGDAGMRQPLRERTGLIISRREKFPGTFIQTLPQIILTGFHVLRPSFTGLTIRGCTIGHVEADSKLHIILIEAGRRQIYAGRTLPGHFRPF
jgi:hypothetical protein